MSSPALPAGALGKAPDILPSQHEGRKKTETGGGTAGRRAEQYRSEAGIEYDRRWNGVDQLGQDHARPPGSAGVLQPVPGKGSGRSAEKNSGSCLGDQEGASRTGGQTTAKNAGTAILPRRHARA